MLNEIQLSTKNAIYGNNFKTQFSEIGVQIKPETKILKTKYRTKKFTILVFINIDLVCINFREKNIF